MSDEKWTKARVLRAYREWQELTRHALDVFARSERAYGRDGYDIDLADRLDLPHWIGSGWPGSQFELPRFDGESERLPLHWLWTNGWEAARKRDYERWRQERAGQIAEQAEKAEYERLRAKYSEPVDARSEGRKWPASKRKSA